MKSGVHKALAAAVRVEGAVDSLDAHRLKTLGNLLGCFNGTLGAQVKGCLDCGKKSCIAHSCRNRSCPRCQAGASFDWLDRQSASLLDTAYYHDVFTLPHCLNPVIRQNRKKCLKLLFDSAAATLAAFAKKELKAKIGVTAVLHTWGQTLCEHYHLHCIVTGGGIASDETRWIDAKRKRMFDSKALAIMFRGKYLAGMQLLGENGDLEFHGSYERLREGGAFRSLLNEASRKKWVVYSKRPFAGPEQVLKYLSLYTHRVGIGDARILEVNEEAGQVRFRYKDYAESGKKKRMRLGLAEFLRRFCLHALPLRFVKIRHYGILSNRCRKAQVEKARVLIDRIRPKEESPVEAQPSEPEVEPLRQLGVPCCPWCGSAALELSEIMRSGACDERLVAYAIPDTG